MDPKLGAFDSQVRFHFLGLCTQIEAKELWPEAAAAPDHTKGSEDVANRIRDGYVPDPELLLVVGHGQGTYGFAGSADCGRLGQSSRKQSGGIAWIKFQQVSNRICRQKANDRHKYTEQSPAPAISFEILKKTRTYRVANSEEEEKKQDRFRLIGHRHVEKISNENPPQQGTCHNSKSETTKLQPPDQVPYAHCQINSHFGILGKESCQPFHASLLRGSLSLEGLFQASSRYSLSMSSDKLTA